MTFNQFAGSTMLPPALKYSVLVDDLGLPRYWATIRMAVNSHDAAPSTEMKTLRRIEALYVFADDLNYPGFLDDALCKCDWDALGDVLEAYFISLRNRPKLTESAQKQWQDGLSFVRDVVTRISKNVNGLPQLAQSDARLRHLDSLYGQLRIQKTRRPDILRSLPAEVVSCLYEMLAPDSPNNPFTRTKVRWTVFIAFVVMLHQGVRRGELLLLPVDAVKSAYDKKLGRDRNWINIRTIEEQEEIDPRRSKPSIKTADSIRQIPVSETTADLVQTYTENYRGRPNHPFLLNTQWNTPLSHESLTAYFSRLSAKLPPHIKKILRDRNGMDGITPHPLRHTCVVVRLGQRLDNGTPMAEALQQMRTLFGWSRESVMPMRYARAVFEDRLADVWANVQDDRITLLRAIPKAL